MDLKGIELAADDGLKDDEKMEVDEVEEVFGDIFDEEDAMVSQQLVRDTKDLEACKFDCFNIDQVESFLKEAVDEVSAKASIQPSIAKHLLQTFQWDGSDILRMLKENSKNVFIESKLSLEGEQPDSSSSADIANPKTCKVCNFQCQANEFRQLPCQHSFCKTCWRQHVLFKIQDGVYSKVSCMEPECALIVLEDFILDLIGDDASLMEKFKRFSTRDYIEEHPLTVFCCGTDCTRVIRCFEVSSKKAHCDSCDLDVCAGCGRDYHAPCGCEDFQSWIKLCQKDPESTAYLINKTKDCPECKVPIDRVDGCNHMTCTKCNHEFCWECFGKWKTHKGNFYECEVMAKDPEAFNAVGISEMRKNLKKFVAYFDKWNAHLNYLKNCSANLKITINAILKSIQADEKTSWIDWEFKIRALKVLKRCHYTLQYSYAHVFFLEEQSPLQKFFEFKLNKFESMLEKLEVELSECSCSQESAIESKLSKLESFRRVLLQ